MKKYDFETVVHRRRTGSMKWRELEDYDCPEDVIPFSVADMELKNMPEVIEGLKGFLDSSVLGYANPSEQYKAAVCGWMERRHGWTVRPEWIVDTPGVIHAFFTAVHAFTRPGDNILLLTPVYYPIYMAAQRNSRGLSESPLLRDESGIYHVDWADLEAKARDPKTTLFILCSPHNPLGRVWTPEELERMAQICLDNGVLICSDEIHNDLIMPGYRHTVLATLREDIAQRSIICTSPSKTFNLAGLQTSNIIIPNESLREQFQREMGRHDGNPKCNILGLEACRLAYTCGDQWLEQVLALIYANYRLVTDFLAAEFPAVRVTPLEGTYLLWIDLGPLGIEPKELDRILREEAHLFFDDGAIFGSAGVGFERWNLACPSSYIEKALERLRTLKRFCP